MRHHGLIIAALGLVVPIVALSPARAAEPVSPIRPGLSVISLLATNDLHGALDDKGAFACTVETAKASLGENKTLFVSAGDNIGASPFVSSFDKDNPTLDYLNALELKTAAVGNHEFDRGFSDLTGRVKARAAFPHLGANVYQRGTTTPVLPTHQIHTVNGVRIGVIGAVTDETPSLVSPSGVAMLDFGDPVEAVNKVANDLTDGLDTNGEADVIVALYHEGAPGSGESLAQELTSKVFAHIVNDTSPKVSAIVNGHTHRVYNFQAPVPGGGGTRPVVQAGYGGAAVAQVQLGYDPVAKKVTQYDAKILKSEPPAAGSPCLTDPQYVAARKVADKAIADSKTVGKKVIGEISDDITTADQSPEVQGGKYLGDWDKQNRDNRAHASALGNLAAQVWRQALAGRGRPSTIIGIQNPGGLRAELLYAPSGEEKPGQVTLAEASAIHPFANTLQTIDITGAQFKTLLEQQWQPGKSRPYLALGLSDNVFYTYDPARPQGNRITGVWVNGAPLSPQVRYTVVSGSFLIEGGDNFTVLREGINKTDSGLIDTDAFMNYFKPGIKVHPDATSRSLAVIGAPQLSLGEPSGVVDVSKTFTFRVEGFDLTSRGTPANSTLLIDIDGQNLGRVPIQTTTVMTADQPRNGVAEITLTVEQLRKLGDGGRHRLTLTASPSSTSVVLNFTTTRASALKPGLPKTGVDCVCVSK